MKVVFEQLIDVGTSMLVSMARVGGVFAATPIFSSPNLPAIFKIGLVLTLSFVMYPLSYVSGSIFELPLLALTGLLLKEILVGLVLGSTAYLFFSIFQTAGQMIDVPMGFGVVNFIDPNLGGQVPLMGRFHFTLAVVVFLFINGHHVIIRSLAYSYKLIPVGEIVITKISAEQFLYWTSQTFIISVQLAMPVIAAMLLVDVGLGLLNRAVPQINVFIVGFPIKIAVGMALVAIGLPFYLALVNKLFTINGSIVEAFFGMMKTLR